MRVPKLAFAAISATLALEMAVACGQRGVSVSSEVSMAPAPESALLTGAKNEAGLPYRFYDETPERALNAAWKGLTAKEPEDAARGLDLASAMQSFEITAPDGTLMHLSLDFPDRDPVDLEGGATNGTFYLNNVDSDGEISCAGSKFNEDCSGILSLANQDEKSFVLLQEKDYFGYLPVIAATSGGTATSTGRAVRAILDGQKALGDLPTRLRHFAVEPDDLRVQTIMGGRSTMKLLISNAVARIADHQMFELSGDLVELPEGAKSELKVSRNEGLDITHAWLVGGPASDGADFLRLELEVRDESGDEINSELLDFAVSTRDSASSFR